jgi:hypothetical protein
MGTLSKQPIIICNNKVTYPQLEILWSLIVPSITQANNSCSQVNSSGIIPQ